MQGRRTTRDDGPPLAPPAAPLGGVAIATSWVEPAYLEPDASWCTPEGAAASPLANGGAFGGKEGSIVADAAGQLASETGRAVRVVFSREDTVRFGCKRPPIAASARYESGRVEIDGVVARAGSAAFVGLPSAYDIAIEGNWKHRAVEGPPLSPAVRAFGLAEQALLVEGAFERRGSRPQRARFGTV